MAYTLFDGRAYDTESNWAGQVIPNGVIAVSTDVDGKVKKGTGTLWELRPYVLVPSTIPASAFKAHIDQTATHETQLGALPSAGQLAALSGHVANTSNPHSTTAAQVGADPSGSAAAAQSAAVQRANHTGTQAATTIVEDSTHRFATDAEKTTWNAKQAALVSGTNIKTINGSSVLGSGNLVVTPSQPVTITPITGGTQNSTSVTLANVTGSSISLATGTWYEISYVVTYSAAATTTGAFFSLNGTATFDYLEADVFGDTVTGDGSTRSFNAFNGGTALSSSRATTNNKAHIQARIHTTGAGTILLRFATEVAASAITITALQGYSRVI